MTNMKFIQTIAVYTAAALLFSCNQTSQTNQMYQEEAAQQIAQQNQQWMAAVEKGDAAAVAEVYTQNAQFMPPNMPLLEGREGIETFIDGARENGVKKIKLKTSELEVSDALAIETGSYQILVEGDQVVDEGKYMIEWRQEDDQWFMHRDIFNSNLPTRRSVALPGQEVWVVMHQVKASRRKDFEDFVWNTLVPAIDQSKPENKMAVQQCRFLIPTDPEPNGDYRYMFIMDPVIAGAEYSIEDVIIKKHGEKKAKAIIDDFNSMLAGNYLTMSGRQNKF